MGNNMIGIGKTELAADSSDGSGPKNTGSGRARAFNVGLGPGPGLGPSLEAGLRAGLGPFIN